MKILVLLLFALSCQANVGAQMRINPKTPVYLKSPAQSSWQVAQAINMADNILLVGQSKSSTNSNKMLMLMTNHQGKTEWLKEFPYPSAHTVAAFNNQSVALLNVSKTELLLTRMNLPQGEVMWQVPLRKMQGGSLATQANGTVAVATENEEYILVNLFSKSGEKSWEVKLLKLYASPGSISKITSLSDGTYAIAGGGKVWGLSESGQILWQFGAKTEPINWQCIKQTQNGEIVVAGIGMNMADNRTNVHIWGIARDGNKISWANLIGEEDKQNKVNDFVELPTGELLFLCREDNKSQLIKLDTEHQASLVYTEENTKNQRLKYLIANPDQTFTLVGNSFNENNSAIVLQSFEVNSAIVMQKKPSLFLLSIGVGADLQYVQNDAEAISNLYKKQAGKGFEKVYIKTLTDSDATKAGELAKVFESLSTQAIKNEDLTIVYFSGTGQATTDDYLLHASDFNATTLRSTTIRLSQLIRDLDNLPGKKWIVLDACKSGAAQNLQLPKNISILTSSTAEQNSYEDDEWQHGALTKVLLDTFTYKSADTNADGFTSLVELYTYVAKVLPMLTQRDKNQTQTPTLLHKGDDFIVFE